MRMQSCLTITQREMGEGGIVRAAVDVVVHGVAFGLDGVLGRVETAVLPLSSGHGGGRPQDLCKIERPAEPLGSGRCGYRWCIKACGEGGAASGDRRCGNAR